LICRSGRFLTILAYHLHPKLFFTTSLAFYFKKKKPLYNFKNLRFGTFYFTKSAKIRRFGGVSLEMTEGEQHLRQS
jgi:hypothetical protein